MDDNNKKRELTPVTTDDLIPGSREDYFRFIKHNIDDYSGITYSPEEQRRIQAHLQKLSTGAQAMLPLFCAGPACPFAARCPYQQIGKAPIGKACLVEVQLLQHWTIQYMEEYEVDPQNFTEVGYCNELAEIEVMLYRVNLSLSKPEHAELVTDQTVGVSHDGTPIIQKQISPFMDQKAALQNRRSKIVKLMVGDRQEKYKKEAALKQRTEKDPSSRMADMRRQIENLQRNLNQIETPKAPSTPAAALEDGANNKDKIVELQRIMTPDALIDSGE